MASTTSWKNKNNNGGRPGLAPGPLLLQYLSYSVDLHGLHCVGRFTGALRGTRVQSQPGEIALWMVFSCSN